MMRSEDSRDAAAERLEALLARCLELGAELGPAAIEKVCAEAPEDAEGLREHLRRLSAVGMLPEELIPESMRPERLPSFESYRLDALLGSGGMGVVYRAVDERSGTTVALKTADPRVPWSDRARERFRREVSAIQRVDHPHVVGVLEVGEQAGLPYYTMPFVQGVTLGTLLDGMRARTSPGTPPTLADLIAAYEERMPAGEALDPGAFDRGLIATMVRLAREVADGLHHLHEKGIVHRDVKPSNILIDPQGHAHLFDLGLAHLVDDRRLTMTGDFAGSPQYAAPEQVTADRGGIDARTDVYGLGATLFESIALRPPLVGRDTPDLLRRIVREEPPPLRQVASAASRDLEVICGLCLEKAPAHRYETARDLADDLGRFLAFERILGRPPGRVLRLWRNARRNPARATAALLTASILVGAPIALVFHNRQLGEQRDAAQAAAETARREAAANREVSEFLESLVLGLEQSRRPADRAAARELLHVARTRLSEEKAIGTVTRAGLLETVARILIGMGRPDEALPLLDISFNLRQVELGKDHPDSLRTLFELAELHVRRGDLSSARGLADRATRSSEDRLDVRAHRFLGELALAEGNVELAASELETALALEGADPGEDGIEALVSLALARMAAGDLDAALACAERSVRLRERSWNPDPLDQARGYEVLASIHDARGEVDAARVARERCLNFHRRRSLEGSEDAERVLERLAASGQDLRPEDWITLGELRGGEPGAEALLRGLEALTTESPTDLALAGRARIALAEHALEQGDLDRVRAELADAAPWLYEARGDVAWVDGWFETKLALLRAELELGLREDIPPVHLDRSATWFRRRVEGVATLDLDLLTTLRARAASLIELQHSEEALELLAGAGSVEARFGSRSRTSFDDGLSQFSGSVFGESMQRGITLLQAEEFERALEVFRTCAELTPSEPVSHINQACALTRLGRFEQALDALGRAFDLGYAYRPEAVELTAADPDLQALRLDPRFEAMLDTMRAERDLAAALWRELYLVEPPGLEPTEPAPLLVVLHDEGSRPEEVTEGIWREVAERLGARLVAPCGRFPLHRDPANGLTFVDTPRRFLSRPLAYEAPVRHAVEAVADLRPIDPRNTYLCARGLGGTLAFHLLATAPELVRGALLLDPALPLELVESEAAAFPELGLAVSLLVDTSSPVPTLPGVTPAGADWKGVAHTLAGLGLRSQVTGEFGSDLNVDVLVDHLRFLGARR